MVSPKKPAFLFLLTILIVSVVVGSLPLGHAQDTEQEEDQRATTESILSILEGARSHIQTTFARLEAHHIPIPDVARSKFDEGVLKAEEAVRLRNQGRYAQANEKALEAMQRFKDVSLKIAEEAGITETEDEREAYKAVGLTVAINRTETLINKLENLADKAEELGYDVSGVRESIAEARSHLGEAVNLAEVRNIEGSEEKVGIAHSMAAKTLGELQPVVKANKARQAEKFLMKAEERLARMEERISKLLGKLPPQAEGAVAEAFERAGSRLQEVKNRIVTGDLEAAVQGLEEVRRNEQRGVEELGREKPRVAAKLLAIEKLENTIGLLEDKLTKLQEKGVDVSIIRTKLGEARSLLEKAVAQLQDGNLDAAEETIDQVEGILHQIDVMIEEVEASGEQKEAGRESSRRAQEKGARAKA